MVYEVPVTHARAELAELVNRVVYGGEHVLLTRHGRAVAALVSADDLARLEAAEASRTDAVSGLDVVQLSSGAEGSPGSPSGGSAPQRFDIAAQHGNPGQRGGRPNQT